MVPPLLLPFLLLCFREEWVEASGRSVASKISAVRLQEDEHWPLRGLGLGEVTGVSIDQENNPVLIHRGPRKWNSESFYPNHTYRHQNLGPILEDVVITVDSQSGTILRKWGNATFYLPHSITIDHRGNTWITDVAMHQIFKFAKGQFAYPELTLGQRFQPGSDDRHFCKPTDVAISVSGDIFVSDGYCNSRIIRYDPFGHMKMQWGRKASGLMLPAELAIPHGIALHEELDIICVADRNHYRIQCFIAGLYNPSITGKYLFQIASPGLAYDITFVDYQIYGATGTNSLQTKRATGFSVDFRNNLIVNMWGPETGFGHPHALTADKQGATIYVADLGYNFPTLWKFQIVR